MSGQPMFMNKPLLTFPLIIRTSKQHRSRKKLYVAIWKNVGDLRKAAKQSAGYGGWDNAAGCYIAVRSKSQFGEIHLWKKMMGAGYWAHEAQHFLWDYADETEKFPLDEKANERIAYLAGDLTAQFWTKFYEQFDVKEKE